jgi:C1A family cysteine protease
MPKYGYIPDQRDQRDLLLAAPSLSQLANLPPRFNVEKTLNVPKAWSQGNLNSCTGFSIGYIFAFERLKQGLGDLNPSKLFIYYNERVIEKTIKSDPGAMIRDGIKVLASIGVPGEVHWPYDEKAVFTPPSTNAFAQASVHKAGKYERIPRGLNAFRTCLAAGDPFVFGFSVYDSFESDEVAKTGVATTPAPTENLLGGHCVACVGYDDSKYAFFCRNSWGTDWGINGYFWLPYQYFTNPQLSSDFWKVSAVG